MKRYSKTFQTKMDDINRFIKYIKERRSFIIASHMNPEGDAIASSLAIACVLKKMRKETWIYNKDIIPSQFSFLPCFEEIKNELPDKKFEVAIIVDTARIDLVGEDFLKFIKKSEPSILKVDHHTTKERFGNVEIIDPSACSTGEVIYSILKKMKHKIDLGLAKCIYTAIFTDTGGFHFPNSGINAFRIASEMVEIGVKPWEIYDALYDHQPVNSIKLLARALSTLELNAGGKIASIYVTKQMLKSTNTTKKDTEGLINYPRSIDGVRIALMFREDDGKIKVSLRSRGDIDVSKFAERFGGGGHKGASAFVFDGTIKSAKQKILKEVERYIS